MAQKQSQIAVIMYTLRDYCTDLKTLAKTLKRVKKIGYDQVQYSGQLFNEADPKELKKIADDTGIKIIGSHIGFHLWEENFNANLEKLKIWECEYTAIPFHRPATASTAGWKSSARKFGKLGQRLAKEGIKLQYHNHEFEFQKFGIKGGRGGVTGYETLLNETGKKELQAELDIGWVARAGFDPVLWIQKLKGRLDQVHVKDWGIVDREPVWRAVGEGNINWKSILKAAKASGTKHFIVEQDSCPVTNNPFKSIEISYEALRKLGLK